MTTPEDLIKKLQLGYLANAKHILEEQQFNSLNQDQLSQYLIAAPEAIPFEDLVDKRLIVHAISSTLEGWTIEETLLHNFVLYIHKYAIDARHPLEVGVIKQKIENITPVMANAYQNDKIRKEHFDRNMDALLHILENSEEKPEILAALQKEYCRLDSFFAVN